MLGQRGGGSGPIGFRYVIDGLRDHTRFRSADISGSRLLVEEGHFAGWGAGGSGGRSEVRLGGGCGVFPDRSGFATSAGTSGICRGKIKDICKMKYI